ncbi:MAG TPA: hypothetical protein VHE30_22250 [Polyangiaceae bacterium]|nr:hypothetical protein [Polyangiaceae bacterium]
MQHAPVTRRLPWGALFAAATGFVLAPRTGHAEESVALRLAYSAPEGCPSPADFLDEVHARTARYRPASGEESATALTVTIREVRGGNQGTLSLASPDGARTARRVTAGDCTQVVSALALMTALAIDPDASTEPVRKRAETTPQATPPPVIARAATKPSRRSAPPVERARLRPGVGMLAEGLAGVAPEPMVLLRPMAELGWTGPGPEPAFRLSGAIGRRATTGSDGGGEFSLASVRVEGCPVRLDVTGRVRVSPCVAMDGGRLQVAGLGVTPSERVSRPWIAGGIVARLEWEIVNVLVLEVAAEGFVPFLRDRFFVGDGATVHRTAMLLPGGTAGLGVRFP